MGFREKIGLKPKASTVNLAGGGGYGFNTNPAQNMYSIPESGFASGPQQQPRTMNGGANAGGLGIPMAIRPSPQPNSFDGTRSISNGSAYSFTTNNGTVGGSSGGFGSSTTSFGTTSTGATSHSGIGNGNGGGGGGGIFSNGIRNFSPASAKSNTTSKPSPAQQQQAGYPFQLPQQQKPQPVHYQHRDPQVTATDVRRCTKLLRQLFELHLELWTLSHAHRTDQELRKQKRMQVDALLVDIHNMVGGWSNMPPETWLDEEYEEIKWIVQTLVDLPPPPY